MELEREYRLVQSLDTAEKRIIRLIGNALAGTGGSQVLDLMDRLNRLPQLDEKRKAQLSKKTGKTLPTVSVRLYNLVVKCLQYNDGGKTLLNRLDLLVFESGELLHRGMNSTASSAADKGLQLATQFGVWHRLPAFISLKRRLMLRDLSANTIEQLENLRQLEKQASRWIVWQQELDHYRTFLVSARRLDKYRRDNSYQRKLKQIAQHPALAAGFNYPDLFSESLAADVKGLLLLAQRKGEKALELYTKLLRRWRTEKAWMNHYIDFYISVFTNYQQAVFWGTVSSRDIRSYLSLLPDKQILSEQHQIDFQRIRYGHMLTIGVNTGQFAFVISQIPEIEDWLRLHRKRLSAGSQLAFRYNICICYFLSGRYREAYRVLQPILQHRAKGNREDILDFSRVLQAVLLFQLQEVELGEYMIRSARYFFRRNPRQWDFEQAVLRYLRLTLTAKPTKLAILQNELLNDLNKMASENSGAYPLLGLTEICCWLESRITGKSITEMFSRRIVKQNP